MSQLEQVSPSPRKVLCLGVYIHDHSAEMQFQSRSNKRILWSIQIVLRLFQPTLRLRKLIFFYLW